MSQAGKADPEDEGHEQDPLLPYDPAEWERRLNAARDKRAAVLARRIDETRGALKTAPIRPADKLEPVAKDAPGAPPVIAAPAAPAPVVVPAAALRPAPLPERPAPIPERPKRRLGSRVWPVAAAFALGLAIGLPLSLPGLRGSLRMPVPETPPQPASEVVDPPTSLPDPVTVPDPQALAPAAAPEALPAIPDPATAVVAPAAPEIAAPHPEPVPSGPVPDPVVAAQGPAFPVPVAPAAIADPVAPDPALAEPSPTQGPELPPAADGPAAPADAADPVPAPIDLPGALPIHVFVPGTVPADKITAVADLLRAAGVSANTPIRARVGISETNVRYYYAEDAPRAARIAEALGADARDFTSFRPSPAPGLIEVWLAGRAPSRGPVRHRNDGQPGLLKALGQLFSGLPPNDPQ